MRAVVSSLGEEQTMTVRRAESADAQGVDALVNGNPSAVAVFGRVNVIHLLEKANLAVTLANDTEQILAHACFLDHPTGDLVDQAEWEPFLQQLSGTKKYKPVNTLFLHLYVSEPTLAAASSMEIMRAVFSAVPELQFVLLLSPHLCELDPALSEIFEPMQVVSPAEHKCVAQICLREQHCPKLFVRPGRVEDHDDVMRVFSEQTKVVSVVDRPFFLAELIEEENENNRMVVCESNGVAVGFISVTSSVDVTSLQQHFDLSEYKSVFTEGQTKAQSGQSEMREETGTASSGQEETEPSTAEDLSQNHRAFSIQFFAIDKNHEPRSVDFLPYIFRLFPDRDLCLITVPTLSPVFPLLQNFHRVSPKNIRAPPDELYALHRVGLKSVQVRRAFASDRGAVLDLVRDLDQKDFLLQDLDLFYQKETDQDMVPLQAFVAHIGTQLVGIVIIRDEQQVEYLRSHYTLENFIYFSHHFSEEHGLISHFVLRPSFRHCSRLLLREVLRLSHKSCLNQRRYLPQSPVQQHSCINHLDFILDCAVPVRPRPQIDFPLDELGINAPSNQITETQPPFSLSLISRKLTLELKVVVNARIVVVGASDTGLSFLETFCCCPHLRFSNLTLVSTHGFPGDGPEEEPGFLSTSHAFSRRELALLPLSSVKTISGKMLSIDRNSKHVLVSNGDWVPYDFLVLCTGLQYQVPCPIGSNQSQSNSNGRFSGPVPSNLFTLNDHQDCVRTRLWLQEHFIHQQDNAIVYGSSIDSFVSVETLLSLGVSGSRIHLVLGPLEPGESSFPDTAVERAVSRNLEKAQVQVHRDYVVSQMNSSENRLTSVCFSSNRDTLELCCGVFLNLSGPGVDLDVFRSIVDSFLVFDSRLVIDSCFRSSDPWVLAAGPLTKFSRRYHTEDWSHAQFCSREVGLELANEILLLFDPTTEPRPQSPPEIHMVPVYSQPKVTGGRLPSGLNYLHVTKPSLSVHTGSTVRYLKDSALVTGRGETGNYFRLQLDDSERVESITCLSMKPLPLHNLLQLFGKQQALLGQLGTRFHMGQVPDFYSYFRQSWCLAIFNDRFCDFQQELQAIASAAKHTLNVQVEKAEEEEGEESEKCEKEEELLDDETRAAIRASAVKYLSYNRNLLPMYAVPGQL